MLKTGGCKRLWHKHVDGCGKDVTQRSELQSNPVAEDLLADACLVIKLECRLPVVFVLTLMAHVIFTPVHGVIHDPPVDVYASDPFNS